MEPEKLGRTLGIGVRVAGNILRDRASRIGQQSAPPAQPPPSANNVRTRGETPSTGGASRVEAAVAGLRGAAQKTEKARGAAARGAKRFGEALWGPLLHAGNVLWLEITGLFFALFAIFFAQNVYRVRGAWKGGPEHTQLLLYVALTALFVWFSVTSFVRARRKGRKPR
jgi:hypothetical protein